MFTHVMQYITVNMNTWYFTALLSLGAGSPPDCCLQGGTQVGLHRWDWERALPGGGSEEE